MGFLSLPTLLAMELSSPTIITSFAVMMFLSIILYLYCFTYTRPVPRSMPLKSRHAPYPVFLSRNSFSHVQLR